MAPQCGWASLQHSRCAQFRAPRPAASVLVMVVKSLLWQTLFVTISDQEHLAYVIASRDYLMCGDRP